MQMKTLRLRATLLVLTGFLSGACASCLVQNGGADDFVRVFGFDSAMGHIYHGKKTAPDQVLEFSDKKIEGFVSMSLSDWTYVRDKLSTCH